MRDHWELTGEQIARTTAWAIETILSICHTLGQAALIFVYRKNGGIAVERGGGHLPFLTP